MGIVVFGSTNTFSGGLSIVGNSTVQIASDGALCTGVGIHLGDLASGGTLRTSGIFTTNRNVTFGGANAGTFDVTGAADAFTITGQIWLRVPS